MITNLVFKRYNTSVNPPRTELKIVEVNIPELNSGEGWRLETSGEVVVDSTPKRVVESTTKVVPTIYVPEAAIEVVSQPRKDPVVVQEEQELKWTEVTAGEKFNSGVEGTAKLIRKKDKIWIAYRKMTKDVTAPNSIAVSDTVKMRFFNSAKEINRVAEFAFYTGDKYFDYWNQYMDEEYERQRKSVNEKRKAIALVAAGLAKS